MIAIIPARPNFVASLLEIFLSKIAGGLLLGFSLSSDIFV